MKPTLARFRPLYSRMSFLLYAIGIFPVNTKGEEALKRVLEKKEIRVAMEAPAKPWVWQEGSKWRGFEYDFMEFVGKEMALGLGMSKAEAANFKIVVVNAPWTQLLTYVRNGKADIAFNGYFGPDPSQIEATDLWSDTYFHTGFSVLYHASNPQVPTIEILRTSKSVMIFPDELSLAILKKVGITPLIDPNSSEYGKFIAKKKYDYILWDLPFCIWEVNHGRFAKDLRTTKKILEGTQGDYSAMTRSDSPEFMKAVNAAIKKLNKSPENRKF